MTRLMRHVLGFICAAVIVLNGAMAGAVSLRAPVSEITICGTHGEEVIRLDAAGNPTEQQECCDCVQCLSLAGGLPERSVAPARSQVLRAIDPPVVETVLRGPISHSRPLPRGPPSAQLEEPAPLRLMPEVGSVLASAAFTQTIRGQSAPGTGQPVEVAS